MVPFGAFLLADQIHASGVLAVVAAGFVVGSGTLEAGYQTRLQERYVWSSVDVLLEAFVFAYIGLNLTSVLEDLNDAHGSLSQVAVSSAVVLLIVFVVRTLSVFTMFGGESLSRPAEKGLSIPPPDSEASGQPGVRRQPGTGRKWQTSPRRTMSWQENVVVSWTGMRGVVTLAAAAAIPVTTAAGEPFPKRATIQAIAFVVTLGTLLLQGTTLPLLIRRLDLSSERERALVDVETQKAKQVAHEAADELLAEVQADPPAGLDLKALAEIRHTIVRQSQDVDELPDRGSHTLRAVTFSRLYRDVLSAQRAALIYERDAGRLDDDAVRMMLERLDLQEAGVSARLQSRL